jgi:hypothetical protein
MFSRQYLTRVDQHTRSGTIAGIDKNDMVFRIFLLFKKKIAEIYPSIPR